MSRILELTVVAIVGFFFMWTPLTVSQVDFCMNPIKNGNCSNNTGQWFNSTDGMTSCVCIYRTDTSSDDWMCCYNNNYNNMTTSSTNAPSWNSTTPSTLTPSLSTPPPTRRPWWLPKFPKALDMPIQSDSRSGMGLLRMFQQ